jgi:hypothetical protein
VVDRIVVEESRVVIQHVVPTGPVRLQTEPHAVPFTTHTRLIFEPVLPLRPHRRRFPNALNRWRRPT